MSIVKIAMPEYKTVLPISGISVKYRPFITKEEKVLLLAQESGDVDNIISAINSIITACTFEVYSASKLNKVDAEYLFLQIRNKSLGEGVEVNGICSECGKRTHIMLNLDKVEIENTFTKDPIQLADDLWVTLRIPTIEEAMNVPEGGDIVATALAIDNIVYGENSFNATEYSLEKRIDFIESLFPLQRVKLDEAFENFPELVFNHKYQCTHCRADNSIHIRGLENFFG